MEKMKSWNPFEHNRIVREEIVKEKEEIISKSERSLEATKILDDCKIELNLNLDNFIQNIDENIKNFTEEDFNWNMVVDKFINFNDLLKTFQKDSLIKISQKTNEAFEYIDLTEKENSQQFALMLVNSQVDILKLQISQSKSIIYKKFLSFVFENRVNFLDKGEEIKKLSNILKKDN